MVQQSSPVDEERTHARAAGLTYVSDTEPGIRRKAVGTGFSYRGLDGKPISDPDVLKRIRALSVPPAWAEVWICPKPNGHNQATGRDDRGRKQYRYHADWREVCDRNKYQRIPEQWCSATHLPFAAPEGAGGRAQRDARLRSAPGGMRCPAPIGAAARGAEPPGRHGEGTNRAES
jgi:hypothetical protein